jgi:hypothetical protein
MAASVPTTRDPRIDFLRRAALLTIFIDHVPGNFLGTFALRNLGFSDAAELFVLKGFARADADVAFHSRHAQRDDPRR